MRTGRHHWPAEGYGSGAKAKFALYRETLRTTAGKPGVFLVEEEFTTMPFPPLSFRSCQKQMLRRPVMRFLRHGGIYRSDVVFKTKPWGGTVPPPAGRPRAQVKERVGRTTSFSSSAMSSGRLFLDRVARQCRTAVAVKGRRNCAKNGAAETGRL